MKRACVEIPITDALTRFIYGGHAICAEAAETRFVPCRCARRATGLAAVRGQDVF